jgi:hypothetical protein
MDEIIQDLIEYIGFDEYEVDTRESDLDRIFFKDNRHFIRIWDIRENGILYSIFEPGPGYAEELECGYYSIRRNFRD